MNKKFFTLVIVCFIFLAACGSGPSSQSVQPTATIVPQTATFTSTPEPTFTPTATPTPRLPVSLGTQMPAPGLALSADNLDQVVELARWGKGVITDAIYSPDGKFIAVATTLGVSIHQADTLEEILYFETNASVNSLAFSPDGETIATGLKDNTLKLWKASDGVLLKSLDGHTDETAKKGAKKAEVTSVAFSPDGNQLAGGSTDGTVSLWQISDGSLVNTLKDHTKNITSVFFSPDGQALFSASWDGKVSMVNVADGKPIRTFAGRDISDSSVSADGKILVADDQGNNSLIIWDVESGKKLQTIKEIEQYSCEDLDMALSPDGQLIAAGLNDHSAKIWSVTSGAAQNTFEDLKPEGNGWYYIDCFTANFSPDGQSMLMAGLNIIGTWDVKKGALLNSAKIKSEQVIDLAFPPDEQMLASVEGPNVNLWKFPDGVLQPSQDLLQSNGSVDFSSDGTTLLASMFDNTARLWPLSDQGVKKSFETDKQDYIRAVAFSPDGQTVALEAVYTGIVELRQVSDGSLIKTMTVGTTYGAGSVGFSSDGQYLAAALNDQVRLFQLADGKALKSFKGGLSIAFSPDGTLLAGGAADKTIKVWTIPEGEVLLTIKDRPDEVWAVAFSPDGKFLVAGYADGTIEIFLASDGTLLKSWKGHTAEISDLLFTSDGKLLISSSYDGTIRTWGIKP